MATQSDIEIASLYNAVWKILQLECEGYVFFCLYVIKIENQGVFFQKVPRREVLGMELVPLRFWLFFAPLVALGGTSVLGDFILSRGTNSILRTFLGGTFRKNTLYLSILIT